MNGPNEFEKLRLAWQEMAGPARPGPACPDPERIWEAQQGKLDRGQVREIILHTGSCPACAESWRLAHDLGAMQARQDLQAEPSKVVSAEFSRHRGPAHWRLNPLAMAAGIVILLGLGAGAITLWMDSSTQDPESAPATYRTSGRDSIQTLVPETRPVAKTACRLAWTPGSKNTRYTVRVTTEDLTQLALAEGLDSADYLVPAAALEDLPPGTRLLWQVRAFLPEGGQTISKTFYITIE